MSVWITLVQPLIAISPTFLDFGCGLNDTRPSVASISSSVATVKTLA